MLCLVRLVCVLCLTVNVSECLGDSADKLQATPTTTIKPAVVQEAKPYCLKLVNQTVLPKCQISFREEGSFDPFNTTCLGDNVFVVHSNRTKPELAHTEDLKYLSQIYEEQMPPYARISCSSPFPSNFDFEGVGALDFFRVWKSRTNTSYTVNAEILLTPEASGNYVFHSIQNPEARTSIFIFSERGDKPFLIGGGRIQAIQSTNLGTILPCIASDLNSTVTVSRQINGGNWTNLNYTYDRQRGFIVNTTIPPGDYRCVSNGNDENSEQPDLVTVHVMSLQEKLTEIQNQKKPRVGIEITKSRAACYSLDNTTQALHFTNVYSQNPTESQLLIQCLQKKNAYCGSHSYHKRREGKKINRPCPKNATTCMWITELHPEGILYCDNGNDAAGNFISMEYFTGLDNKIYDTASNLTAIANVLLKPTWEPDSDTTNLKTGIKYQISCKAAGLVLQRDPYKISLKLKNGTVGTSKEIIWWEHPKTFLLTNETDEIICADNFWITNLPIQAGIKINISENICDANHFKCSNGECVQLSYRCDGVGECEDLSDEENCKTHTCPLNYFKCGGEGKCIHAYYKCDNHKNCDDASDESIETCKDTVCNEHQIKCQSGQCIYPESLCNENFDCFDKSDEDKSHCGKFYPEFLQTATNVSLNMYSMAELICKVKEISALSLKPTLEWWRDGKKIPENDDRLWQSAKWDRLSLRFPNVSSSDGGDFTCFASNKFQKIQQKFTVNVQFPKADMTCWPELGDWECRRRGCYFTDDTCYRNQKLTTANPSPLSQTTPRTTMPTTTQTVNTVEKSALNSENSHSNLGIVIGVALFFFVVFALILTVLRWRQSLQRTFGFLRFRDDRDPVLNGIQLQNQS